MDKNPLNLLGFSPDSRFNPAEDPSICVYISNLRKKLKKYYSEEGKRDKVKLGIPPGHYFMNNSKDENKGIIRLHNINSDEDLEKYLINHPEYRNYKKTPYTFTPHLSLIPVKRMMPFLCSKKDFDLESAGVIKTADLLKNDILFIGSFRNLYIMRQLLSDLIKDIKIGLGENNLKFSDSLKVYTLQGYPQIKHTDYCLFRKIPGPKSNYVIMLVSFFETGMSEASSYLTNPQTLKELNKLFKKKYGEMPEYFDCLFRVSGLERTGLTIKVEYFAKIDPKQLKIW